MRELRNCCLCSGSGVLTDSPASPPESKTDSGPSEFPCLLTLRPTRWPPPSCLRSKQWKQITPIRSFLKMSPFPPHLRHSWISKPEGDVSEVAGTTGDSDGLRTTGHPLHSLLPTALQPWFLVSAVFVYIYLPFKSQAARFQVQGTISLHLSTSYLPCRRPQSLRQTLALSDPGSLLSGAETVHVICFCSCSHFCLESLYSLVAKYFCKRHIK